MPAIKEEFEECPYCGWLNIEQNKNGKWTCLHCFEQWDDEGML